MFDRSFARFFDRIMVKTGLILVQVLVVVLVVVACTVLF